MKSATTDGCGRRGDEQRPGPGHGTGPCAVRHATAPATQGGGTHPHHGATRVVVVPARPMPMPSFSPKCSRIGAASRSVGRRGNPSPRAISYQYDFDHTSAGDLRLAHRQYEILHRAYRLLRDELRTWNQRVAGENGAKEPYQQETSDHDSILKWGERQLRGHAPSNTPTGSAVRRARRPKPTQCPPMGATAACHRGYARGGVRPEPAFGIEALQLLGDAGLVRAIPSAPTARCPTRSARASSPTRSLP